MPRVTAANRAAKSSPIPDSSTRTDRASAIASCASPTIRSAADTSARAVSATWASPVRAPNSAALRAIRAARCQSSPTQTAAAIPVIRSPASADRSSGAASSTGSAASSRDRAPAMSWSTACMTPSAVADAAVASGSVQVTSAASRTSRRPVTTCIRSIQYRASRPTANGSVSGGRPGAPGARASSSEVSIVARLSSSQSNQAACPGRP